MILVSYILPCYNTEKYIDQCISSLYEQGFEESEFEVICVNNASQDNLDENIKKAKSVHDNIVHIRLTKNVFSGGAYNEGIRASRGKYIVFVDSDDYMKANSVRPLIEDMQLNNLEAIQINIQPFGFSDNCTASDLDNLNGNGNMKHDINMISGVDYLSSQRTLDDITRFPIPAYRRFYLRDFIVKNDLYFSISTMGCDLLHTYQAFSLLKKLKIISEKIYMFRYNPSGVTKSGWSIEKVSFLITNMLKSYDVTSEMKLETSIKDLYLQHIKDLLNMGLNKIDLLTMEDKRKIINGIDLDEIASKTDTIKLVYKHPSLYLFLYDFFNDNMASLIVRFYEYAYRQSKRIG